MATIVTNLTCELTGAVQVKVLQGNLFSADNAGNTINVFVTNHGLPAALGGTISANVIRGDGTTVAVSGAIDGNRAYIILPQACYAIPGVIQIIIKNTESSTTTTIAAVVANVYESTTDTVVDPGNIIPSVAALVEAIEDAVADIPAGYNACFAPAYSTSSTYALGQYVTYNGYLYRCTTAITSSESWTAAHWTQVALANDVSALKSAINYVNYKVDDNDSFVDFGYTNLELAPSGNTGASAVGVTQYGNIFILNNPSSSPSSDMKMKISNGIFRTTSNGDVKNWEGMSLKIGHIYKVTSHYISGSANIESPNVLAVYREGTWATIGVAEGTATKYTRTFKYYGTPVSLAWFVPAGTKFYNYAVYITLEDTTENLENDFHEHNLRDITSAGLVGYDNDDDYLILADESAGASSSNKIGVYRHKTNIVLNGGGVSVLSFVKISGEVLRAAAAADVKEWDGISLTNGAKYRATLEKISGTASGDILLSVYRTGESATIGRASWVNNRYIREFVPDSNLNLVLYIPSGTTFTDAEYCVTLQDISDEDIGIGTCKYYTGESVNPNKRISCEKYMTISNETSNARQGATIYGKYLFVAYNKMPMISVYDFDTKTLVNNISFTPVNTYHCNNMNFGVEKYDSADDFPLLYVSQENENEHKCLVFRITVSNDEFSATLVQTITYPVPSTVGQYYQNCFIDTINNLMFIEGYTQNSYSTGDLREFRIMGYHLPKLSEGDVTLEASEAVQNFTMAATKTSTQGGFVSGDKIVQVFGKPETTPEIYLAQISLTAERFVTMIELNDIGITNEPESVFVYKGHLYIFMVNRDIYKLYCD